MKQFVVIALLGFQFLFSQKTITHIVYFETDKFDIPETENYRLLSFLKTLETIDINKVTIYGFCDDRGSNDYNLTLSQNRANAIKNVFSNNEFDDSLISNTDGKGELLLTVLKESDIAKLRGLNRKVEIVVTPVFPAKEIIQNTSTLENTLKGKLKVGDKVLLENLLFERGYSFLVPESKVILDKVAAILKKNTKVYFTIEGHVCCTNGSRDAIDNKTRKRDLSHARAKYVYNYLAKKGVSRSRMKYRGMKRNFPLGGMQKFDRRVELLVTRVLD